jgi:hypothetical protein
VLVLLPLVGVVAWTCYAAAFSGDDRDGMPVWQITLFIGGALACGLALALTAGVDGDGDGDGEVGSGRSSTR